VQLTPASVHFSLAAQEITRHRFRFSADFGADWIKLSF
jgi:hypothetical protein